MKIPPIPCVKSPVRAITRKPILQDGLFRCSKCTQEKPSTSFYPARNGRISSQCKKCHIAVCREGIRRDRYAALKHYSQGTLQCACCGGNTYEFLNLDHKAGGGGQHRKITNAATAFYRWLRMDNFPEGYRVLCYNCNNCIGHYGYCPHNTPPELRRAGPPV